MFSVGDSNVATPATQMEIGKKRGKWEQLDINYRSPALSGMRALTPCVTASMLFTVLA